MRRTMNRPIPTGRISKWQGKVLSLASGAAGLACLSHFPLVTPVTGAAIWLSYLYVYVPLKRTSRYNTHVGAIIGSLPSYLGWSAATVLFTQGTLMGIEPLLMSAFMVAWQFPHFYGILWSYKDDFLKGGFKMITNEDASGEKSALGAKLGAGGLLVSSLGMVSCGMINWWMYLGALMYTTGPLTNALARFSTVSGIQFPNKENAWKMTVESYRVIGVLFWLVMLTMGYNYAYHRIGYQFVRNEKKIYEDAVPCEVYIVIPQRVPKVTPEKE